MAVDENHRNLRVFPGLLLFLAKYGDNHDNDLAIVSGIVRQLKLYSQLKFVPFGPLVGTVGAKCQPMYLTLAGYEALKAESKALAQIGEYQFGTIMGQASFRS